MDLGKLRYLDPYYYFDAFWERYVGEGGPTKTVGDILYTIILAVFLYYLLGVLLHTPRPIVIVASTSMVPTLHRGDIAVVMGIPPASVEAPEVYLDVNENFHVLPSDINIHFIREGIELREINVAGKVIPLERNGTIIVYHDDLQNRDIIHRAILKIKTPRGYLFLTKGDNDETNPTADQDCIGGMCVYPFLISQNQVLGTPILVIPRIGLIKLIFFPSG